MATYKELLAQQKELELQLEKARQNEVDEVVGKIRDAIGVYEISPLDLYSRKELQAALGSKGGKVKGEGSVPVKYRDPESGATWSGRGRMPRWLTPETLDQFAV
jgi:DNA-binding protein H-NS